MTITNINSFSSLNVSLTKREMYSLELVCVVLVEKEANVSYSVLNRCQCQSSMSGIKSPLCIWEAGKLLFRVLVASVQLMFPYSAHSLLPPVLPFSHRLFWNIKQFLKLYYYVMKGCLIKIQLNILLYSSWKPCEYYWKWDKAWSGMTMLMLLLFLPCRSSSS